VKVRELRRIEPWQWPENAASTIRSILKDRKAKPSDRLIAIDLAGNYVIISDEMTEAILTVLADPTESATMRARAAISLGPMLETVDLELDDDDPPITETTLAKIVFTLEHVYRDTNNPKEVRRRAVEGSVRFPQPWHPEAIRTAYQSGDREWILTAVFAMRYVKGFEDLIVEELKNPDQEIHIEAIRSAGTREIDAAWPHIVELLQNPQTHRDLLLAAIAAAPYIRSAEAPRVLRDLTDTPDEEISEAAEEAISDARSFAAIPKDLDETAGDEEDEEDEDDEEDEWVN
jgi:uncharacterized protein (UPF0147 family)